MGETILLILGMTVVARLSVDDFSCHYATHVF